MGTIVQNGDRFVFEPAGALRFAARAGEKADLVVAYRYEEASEEREDTLYRLSLDLDGQKTEPVEARVGDRPAVHDEVRGVLVRQVRLQRRGEVNGAFVVEAHYVKDGWSGRSDPYRVSFRHEGRFVVDVD